MDLFSPFLTDSRLFAADRFLAFLFVRMFFTEWFLHYEGLWIMILRFF